MYRLLEIKYNCSLKWVAIAMLKMKIFITFEENKCLKFILKLFNNVLKFNLVFDELFKYDAIFLYSFYNEFIKVANN